MEKESLNLSEIAKDKNRLVLFFKGLGEFSVFDSKARVAFWNSWWDFKKVNSCVFESLNLSEVVLPGINLEYAVLNRSNFADSNLQGSRLEGAQLQYADFTGADLRGADLREAHLNNAVMPGANLEGANLAKADIVDAILVNANLRKSNLYGTNLDSCDIKGADFEGASINAKWTSLNSNKNWKMAKNVPGEYLAEMPDGCE